MDQNLSIGERRSQGKTSLSENGLRSCCGKPSPMPARGREFERRQHRKLYIGEWLSRLGKKPTDAAKAIGVTESYMSELISGKKKNPHHALLYDLAEWLGLSINDLYRLPPNKTVVEATENLSPSQIAILGQLLDQIQKKPRK